MDIQHLRYALEVKRCGSISKAAQELFMSQPNLSNAIKELEQELNLILFERHSHGVVVTRRGEEFLSRANGIVNQFQQFADHFLTPSPTSIRTAITTVRSSVICTRLIRFINQVTEDGMDLRVQFREGTNHDVLDDINTGRSELGIIRANSSTYDYYRSLARANQCKIVEIPSEPYTVLMSRDHPLAQADPLTAEMLTPYTEIIHGDFEPPWYLYSDAYSTETTAKRRVLFVYDRGSLLDCVRTIQGAYSWTFRTAPENLQINGLVEKACRDYNINGREAIIYKKTTNLSEDLLHLIDYLKQDNDS